MKCVLSKLEFELIVSNQKVEVRRVKSTTVLILGHFIFFIFPQVD
jgi:hypothetical protein